MFRRVFLKACAAVLPAFALVNRETESEDVIVSYDRGDRGTLTDANGNEVHKVHSCLEANLTTGRCVVRKKDIHGQPIVNSLGESMLVTIDLPAPMSFEPYGNQPWGYGIFLCM